MKYDNNFFNINFVRLGVTTCGSMQLLKNIRYFTYQIVLNHLDFNEIIKINRYTAWREKTVQLF